MSKNAVLTIISNDEYRFVLFTDGRAFVHGTNDVKIGKRLYAKYIG